MGLLAKATAMREQWEQEEKLKVETAKLIEPVQPTKSVATVQPTLKQTTTKSEKSHKLSTLKPEIKKPSKNRFKQFKSRKLRYVAAAIFALSLSLQPIAPRTANNSQVSNPRLNSNNTIVRQSNPEIDKLIDEFIQGLQHRSKISAADRDDLARLVYGEAGRSLADATEVIHTVLNRTASPLFDSTLHDVITAKNQYIGYSPKHPVDPKLRELVDFVVDEWESNQYHAIDDCDRYYFRTGIPCVSNQFEITPKGTQGRWTNNKHYDEIGHYCQHAVNQAERFDELYNHRHSTKHTEPSNML